MALAFRDVVVGDDEEEDETEEEAIGPDRMETGMNTPAPVELAMTLDEVEVEIEVETGVTVEEPMTTAPKSPVACGPGEGEVLKPTTCAPIPEAAGGGIASAATTRPPSPPAVENPTT